MEIAGLSKLGPTPFHHFQNYGYGSYNSIRKGGPQTIEKRRLMLDWLYFLETPNL